MLCETCRGHLHKDANSLWGAWHSLFVMVTTLNSEGTITDLTMHNMHENLLTLKGLIPTESATENDTH